MILKRYYVICVRVPTGYPDVCTITAINEEEVRAIYFYRMGLALIDVIEAKG